MHDNFSGFSPSDKLIHGVVFIMAMLVVIGITQFINKPFDDAQAAAPTHFTMQNKPFDFAKRN